MFTKKRCLQTLIFILDIAVTLYKIVYIRTHHIQKNLIWGMKIFERWWYENKVKTNFKFSGGFFISFILLNIYKRDRG